MIEVVASIAIIGIIAIPFLGLFLQSTRVQVKAGDISQAGYIAQNIIEDLRVKSYAEAAEQDTGNGRKSEGNYYVQIRITPYVQNGQVQENEYYKLTYVSVKVYDKPMGGSPLAIRQTIMSLAK